MGTIKRISRSLLMVSVVLLVVGILYGIMASKAMADPAACETIGYHCNFELFYTLPSDVGPAQMYAQRFTPPEPSGCTLTTVQMYFLQSESQNLSGAGIDVLIWADDGFGNPGPFLLSIPIPGADIQWYPLPTTIPLPVPLDLPPGDFHVGFTTIDPAFDTFALLADDGSCPVNGSRVLLGTEWIPLPDLTEFNSNFAIETELCCLELPPEPPFIANFNPELTYEFDFCRNPNLLLAGVSPSGTELSYNLISGPGFLVPASGEWGWEITSADIGTHTLELQVCDSVGCSPAYSLTLNVTNVPPLPAAACDAALQATSGDHIVYFFEAIGSERCDEVSYSLISGPGAIDPVTGVYEWETEPSTVGIFSAVLAGSDGFGESVNCELTIEVSEPGLCGDANGDGNVNVGDAVYIINYVFSGGPAPDPLLTADVNLDGAVNVGDGVYLINYIFKSGPVPCSDEVEEPCCEAPPCDPNPDVAVTYDDIPSTRANCGGNFGLFQVHRATATYTACCLDGDTWQMRVTEVTSPYSISVCAQGRTDVNGAGDVANLQQCQDAVADLTSAGNPPRAPRADYTSTSCSQVHEEKHLEEWRDAFDAEWETAEDDIEMLTVACVEPTPDTPAEAAAAMKAQADAILRNADDDAWDNTPNHGPPDTSGANNAQKTCHDNLITALKAAFPGC